jgi:enoyl-CoA hydratase
MSDKIIIEHRASVLTICLNRPHKLNSLSRSMIEQLTQLFASVKDEPGLRAVILTGAGDKSFCAGTDITELAEAVDSNHAHQISERGQALCDRIEKCGVPVIAAINGVAAGGGLELALAGHLRIASESAQFSLPETKLGVVPAYGGTQRLAREIGLGRANELMLTGRTIDANEALQLGLVNRVVSAAELMSQAASLAQEIAQLAPLAIRACLEAVIEGSELPLAEGLALETKLFSQLFATADMREGTNAFLEKRKPFFEGK